MCSAQLASIFLVLLKSQALGLGVSWALAQEEPKGQATTGERLLGTIPDDVKLETPWFSAGGSRAAYVGRRNGKTFVSVDGVDGEEFTRGEFDIVTLAFSPDGKRVAYSAK